MRLFKSNTLLKFAQIYLNSVKFIALCFLFRIFSGVTLTMHFTPLVLAALERAYRDVIIPLALGGFYHFAITTERSVKYLSLSTRFYSTTSKKVSVERKGKGREICKLYPNFLTGFVDGEGCFSVSITEDPKYKQG